MNSFSNLLLEMHLSTTVGLLASVFVLAFRIRSLMRRIDRIERYLDEQEASR
jgi:hypothetical protein